MQQPEIRKLTHEDEIPYHLLYLADESITAVADYIHRGEMYMGQVNGEIIGIYVLLPTRPFTIELINLAVDEAYQGKGYGKALIRHAIETAKEKGYKVLEVGTGNAGIGQLALYQKCGFTIYGEDMDFFEKHYDHPIFENGIQCLHMIRMKMDL